MTACPDCSAVITCAEVTAPDGHKFITVHEADLAALIYRPAQGYIVRTVTGRRCESAVNHTEE